ncbi:MAG: enoyl-CoA hydratase-related protein [Bacteriovoracaceae bacterium]|nr:enoyl-CoA hydratase-related protein [Bacteriovoracaceae bacterium]
MAHLIVQNLTNHIVLLTLNNPQQKNAITYEMIDLLEQELLKLDTDLNCRVVILTGADSAFSAGGDVKAMKDQTGMFAGKSPELRDLYIHGIQRIPRIIERFQKPIIAFVNGAAVGAGCDLTMMCDLRVGYNHSQFAETFNRLGLVPGDGGTFFLQRVLGYSKAMNMFLTGKFFKGSEAFQYGLLDYFYATDDRELAFKECLNLAETIVNMAPIAVRYTKKAMKLSYLSTMEDALEALATYQSITQRTEDHREAVDALLEKRSPVFENR